MTGSREEILATRAARRRDWLHGEREGSRAPRYIAINRNQQVLQPLDVDRLIDEDQAARKIWRVVEQLDLSRFEEGLEEGLKGTEPKAREGLLA